MPSHTCRRIALTQPQALLHLAALANAITRITKKTTKIPTQAVTTDTPTAAAAPPAPLPCAPKGASTDASTPNHVPHAAAADAPTAAKASWFVRAVSGLKDKWSAVIAAAATKTPAAAEKHAPTPRTASATSSTSTTRKSNTAQAAAATPGDGASAPKASEKANWFARAFATAEAKCGAACDSVAASWRASAAKATAALTPKRKVLIKKSRSSKADTKTSSLPTSPAALAPVAGPIDNASPTSAAADDAAVLVSVVAPAAPEPTVAALKPGSKAGAAATPRWGKYVGDRFRAALPRTRSGRRPTTPAAPIKARSGGTPAKPCDAEPATAAAVAAPKGRVGAALTAKLARLSSRRSRDRPDQVAAAAVGGEAAVAC
jgi:hypothetical protein